MKVASGTGSETSTDHIKYKLLLVEKISILRDSPSMSWPDWIIYTLATSFLGY